MTSAHPEWVWRNGSWVRWEEATVHVTAPALHYGSSAFESHAKSARRTVW